jgi:hypothetical protein
MDRPKEPTGHIARTFLPTTLPIYDIDDDNFFSKTPSMMSPHTEKSPKLIEAKTPKKGKFIEFTSPSPQKSTKPNYPKLSLSIHMSQPGSPML